MLGRALLFFPSSADGEPDDRTLHAGEPTDDGGDKWNAQIWLHASAYSAAVPAGTSHADAEPAVREAAAELGLRLPWVVFFLDCVQRGCVDA